ncbi:MULTISPECIES: enoyl-CoA hydratase/isomerase family protein [Cryobacterium]|nr:MULTISPECIES: enoyl-CoA hydratase/isomerase family protein [Cryobacterium]
MTGTDVPTHFATFEMADQIAFIRLHRPERLNAASPQLVADLKRALDQAAAQHALVTVISGDGRAFCAGHDLKAETLPPDSPEALEHLHALQGITRLLRDSATVSIAAVHGYALGAGMEFALSCDFIVADAGTQFGFPEVSVGLSVTGGISYLLPQAVGLPMAKELILLGETFGAEKAKSLGLINRVTAPGDHLRVAEELARRLLALPHRALSLAKEAFESAVRPQVETAMKLEIQNALLTGDSADAADARDQFATTGSRPAGSGQ